MIGQGISLAGATMILFAYAAHQAGRLDRNGVPYLALNLIGSAILTVFAVQARQAGLIALEGAWAIVSLVPLIGKILRTTGWRA